MEHALPADDLRPQRPGGLGRGALLAIAAHAGLIAALAIGVHWRASEPAAVSAELWAQVPQTAAPKAELPPPPPQPKPQPKPEPAPPTPKPVVTPPASRDAEIALEQQKKKQAAEQRARELAEQEQLRKKRAQQEAERREQEKRELTEVKKKKKAEAERAAQAKREAAEAAEEAAQAQRIEAQRKANLERMLGQAGATGSPTATGQAARDAGPSVGYAGRIVARIRPNIVLVDSVPGNPVAVVEVRAAADGTIVGRRITKGSGHAAWDQAVLRAIDRTEVLPRDVDGRVPPLMTIEFRPRD